MTAGKYKRTLTPTKKIEKADFDKIKEDIEQILHLFQTFVAEQRPKLDIAKVATGETWLGPDALKQSLVDGLATVDEVLTAKVDNGAEVYSLKYAEAPKSPLAALAAGAGSGSLSDNAAIDAAITRGLTAMLGGGALGGAFGGQGLLARLAAALGSAGAATERGGAYGLDASWDGSAQPLAMRPPGAAEPEARWEGSAPRRGGDLEEPTWFL